MSTTSVLRCTNVRTAKLENREAWNWELRHTLIQRQTMEAVMATAETIAKPGTKPHALIPSDRVEGTVVRRTNGGKIRTIQRLMFDKMSGNVAYAVLRFGGLLGIRQDHPPIPLATPKVSRPTH